MYLGVYLGITENCNLGKANYELQVNSESKGEDVAFIGEKEKVRGAIMASHWLNVAKVIN